MNENKKTINSNFRVSGKSNNKIMSASFEIVSGEIPFKTRTVGSFSSSKIISGQITRKNPYNPLVDIEVSNAKITAIKDGIVYDYDITREDGSYYLYLETGVYDIRIESQSYNRTFKNQEIRSGIKECKVEFVDGRAKSRAVDSINFEESTSAKRLIYGTIVDEQGLPVENVEIIVGLVRETEFVKKRELVVFTKTNADGYFSFVIDGTGPYDVIVRSSKHHAKVIKKYKFNNMKHGFFTDIVTENLFFRKNKEWILIEEVVFEDEVEDDIKVDIRPPTKPKNLDFKNLDSDDEWELDWEDSSDESGSVRYELYADDVMIGKTASSNFDFNGQLSYYYGSYFKVKAIDLYGNYNFSEVKKYD